MHVRAMDSITMQLQRGVNKMLNFFKTDEQLLVSTLVNAYKYDKKAECVEHFTSKTYTADLWHNTRSTLLPRDGLFICNGDYGRNYGSQSGLFLVMTTYGHAHSFEDGILQTIFKYQPVDPQSNFTESCIAFYDTQTSYTLSPLYVLLFRDHKPNWGITAGKAWDNKWIETVKIVRYFKEHGVTFSTNQGITVEKFIDDNKHSDVYSLFYILKSFYGFATTSEGRQALDDIIELLVESGCTADVGSTKEIIFANGTKKVVYTRPLFSDSPVGWYPNFDDVLKFALKKKDIGLPLLKHVRTHDVTFRYV